MYDNFLFQKQIYECYPTTVSLISNGSQRVIRKQIALKANNRKYGKNQLRLMKEINHPYVVKLLSYQYSKDKLTVYIPFYENLDLQSYLNTHQIDFQTKIRMFIDILVGIKELHSRYIIHRDIKLKNIFVDNNHRCVIGDLGIATKTLEAVSRIGTPGSNDPSIYSHEQYNEIIDIWALGIIAYQLFNRKKDEEIAFPFKSLELMRSIIIKQGGVNYQSYMNLTREIQPMDEDLPVQIKQMIQGMLKNNRKERLSWVQFYKFYYLQKWDLGDRLLSFMDEYKMIEDTKETLKEYLASFKEHKEKYFFPLRHVLHHEQVDFFKQKYALVRENLIDIHIAHFKLMRKTLDRYAYIASKKIYKYVLNWKEFMKAVKNEIHPIEHRINYRLRNNKEPQIKTNPKYLSTQYFNDTLKIIDTLLKTIDPRDFEDMQQL